MGLATWFSATARKSAAAASVEAYLEICQRQGLFAGNPAQTANKLIEAACSEAPTLVQGRFRPMVFASGALAITVTHLEDDYPARSFYAMALSAMMKGAVVEDRLTSADMRILEGCELVLRRFNEQPSPVL